MAYKAANKIVDVGVFKWLLRDFINKLFKPNVYRSLRELCFACATSMSLTGGASKSVTLGALIFPMLRLASLTPKEFLPFINENEHKVAVLHYSFPLAVSLTVEAMQAVTTTLLSYVDPRLVARFLRTG